MAGTAQEALDRLLVALEATSVLGVTTNRGFLRWLLADEGVRAGVMHTSLIEERWQAQDAIPTEAWQASAHAVAHHTQPDTGQRLGFRLNAPPRVLIEIDQEVRAVDVAPRGPTEVVSASLGASTVSIDLDGRSIVARVAPSPTVESATRHAVHEGASSARVSAPMPGTVLAVRVQEGDQVEVGQVLVVLEAMKMENTVPAPGPGRVERVLVEAGQQVQRGETLVELS